MEDSSNSGIDTLTPAANVQERHDSSSSEVNMSDDEHREEEGFDESEIDPLLLKKLKKGAAKLTPKQREIRKKKDDNLTLHSETQRMVRESRVNIPYHQPSPKSINAFLARASMKQQQYKVLRGVRDSTKAKVLQGLLEKTRIVARKKTQEEMDKYSDSDEDWSQEIEDKKSLRERLREKFDEESPDLEKIDSANYIDSESAFDNINVIENDQGSICERKENRLIVEDDVLNKKLLKEMECPEMRSECVLENQNPDGTEVDGDIHENSEKGQILKPINPSENRKSIEMDVGLTANICDFDENDVRCKVKDIHAADRSDEQTNGDKTEHTDQTSRKKKTSLKDGHFSSARKKQTQLALFDVDHVKPCLSGNVDTFITLEEEPEVQMNTGVAKLLDRLHRHSAKREKKPHADVDISIISKDVKGTAAMEELKLNTFVYHMAVENDNPLLKLDAPGAKLVALKEQLQEKIKAKRERARQQRQEAYDFDNEEAGYEEEAEMSEHSDTDVEDDDFAKQFGDNEEEVGYEGQDEEMNEEEYEKNLFADEEADEDDEEDGELKEEEDNDEGDVQLKLDVSDDEEEKDVDEQQNNIKAQKGDEHEVAEKSDMDSFKEPVAVKISDKPFSIFGRQNGAGSSQFQSGQKNLSVLPPIEDSQDLYGTIPEIPVTQMKHPAECSHDFKFLIEDSQSNMLDADGYLRTEPSQGLTIGSIEKDDFVGTEGNMDELLGLCSGRFAESQTKDKMGTKSDLFVGTAAESNTQKTMDELMGLCSGVFVDQPSVANQNKGVKRRMSDEDSDEDSLTTFTDDEQPSPKNKNTIENEEDTDTDNLGSETEDQLKGRNGDKETDETNSFVGFTVDNKHGKIRRDFVEEEAELSGSEYDSDENLDIPEEEDIMEMEEGDRDAANMDQVKLRDEVGRVYLKRMIDEDKRELLRFQEMYLPDGDLHSEGGGRLRRFKWNNMDDNSHQDMFEGSDNEQESEEADDAEWRKERYEREKFLKEQQEKEKEKDESNSQFLQLGKVFLKKKVSIDYGDVEKQKSVQTSNTSAAGSETSGLPATFYKLPQQKKGSFLARSKKALAKIAEMTKPTVNPSAGAKTTGKFTFSVISPEKEKDQANSSNGNKRTAHIPTSIPCDKKLNRPPVKKLKMDSQSSLNRKSIFNHF